VVICYATDSHNNTGTNTFDVFVKTVMPLVVTASPSPGIYGGTVTLHRDDDGARTGRRHPDRVGLVHRRRQPDRGLHRPSAERQRH